MSWRYKWDTMKIVSNLETDINVLIAKEDIWWIGLTTTI